MENISIYDPASMTTVTSEEMSMWHSWESQVFLGSFWRMGTFSLVKHIFTNLWSLFAMTKNEQRRRSMYSVRKNRNPSAYHQLFQARNLNFTGHMSQKKKKTTRKLFWPKASLNWVLPLSNKGSLINALCKLTSLLQHWPCMLKMGLWAFFFSPSSIKNQTIKGENLMPLNIWL